MQVQSYPCKPRVTYKDHNFMGKFTLELIIMDNNTLSVKIPEEKIKLDRLTTQELMKNSSHLN